MKTLNLEPQHLFVTGTDTDVGKSVLSFLLLKAMAASGLKPLYLKPLQTGCSSPDDPQADAAAVAARLGTELQSDFDCGTLCCLPQPKAPWLAAMNAGQPIEPELLLKKINALREGRRAVVVEGAGGLMVPITEDFLMIDLMAALNIPVVLVARDGLGTINHTLLSIAALKARGIPIQAVVLSTCSSLPAAPEMVAENIMAIEHFGKVPMAGAIGWIEDFKAVPKHIMAVIQEILTHSVSREMSIRKGASHDLR